MIRIVTLSYEASALCSPFSIMAFSDPANNSKIAPATSATQPLAGTTGKMGGAAGTMVDVEKVGLPRVQLGGTVGAGDPLTSNAASRAIKATVAGQRIIGFAEQPGVADDIINYIGAPGVLGGV